MGIQVTNDPKPDVRTKAEVGVRPVWGQLAAMCLSETITSLPVARRLASRHATGRASGTSTQPVGGDLVDGALTQADHFTGDMRGSDMLRPPR
ncbi:hypothetical protein GCM10027290_65690 [Micromonospora sonneratiae]